MQFGRFDVTSLSDGLLHLDGGAMFGVVPKVLWERKAPADELNRIALSVRPLLVRTETTTVLIDAGIGNSFSAKDEEMFGREHAGALERSMQAAGVAPDDVDVVIATHLHFDHVGGLTVRGEDGLRPRFPRARHVVRRGEWEDATHPHERNRASYRSDDFLPILAAGLIDFIDEDTEVVPGIRVERTGGHTRHHQIVRLESDGRRAVFAADLLPTAAHLEVPWVMGYDLFPVDTVSFKRNFLREAVDGEYVIFFEHDPVIEAGIIRDDGRRRRVERVTEASVRPLGPGV